MKNDKEIVPEQEKQETAIPKWLKNIQENSWELELLISGGAIFSLFQLDDILIKVGTEAAILTGFLGMVYLVLVGFFALKFLTLGFFLHLCFRAYWLCLLCVNYAYPNGINHQKNNIQKPFKNSVLENNNIQDKIIKTNRYASLIIFASILGVFILVSIIIILLLFFIIVNINLSNKTILSEIIGWGSLSITLLYILDVLLLNGLRKIKYFSYILFPFFWLFDLISLRWFYRSAFVLFASNVNKKRFVIVCIPFLLISFVISYLSIYKAVYMPNLFDQREYNSQLTDNYATNYNLEYKDEQSPEKWYPISVSSKIQKGNYVEVFIPYSMGYDARIKKLPLSDSLKTLERIIEVKIDSVEIKNFSWFSSSAKNGYAGVMAMIPIRQFDNGEHTLFITIGEKVDKDNMSQFVIPFWIDRDEK
jgi:hypothetical protein